MHSIKNKADKGFECKRMKAKQYNKPRNKCIICGKKCWGKHCRRCSGLGRIGVNKKKFDIRVGRHHPNKIYRKQGYKKMPSII